MRCFTLSACLLFVTGLPGQELCPPSAPPASSFIAVEDLSGAHCVEPQTAQQDPQPLQPATPDGQNTPADATAKPAQSSLAPDSDTTKPPPQPKRILGVMPNFRAVSAATLPPAPTPKQSLWIATQNSFDYSSFIFTGFTSLEAQATNQHPQLGKE